MNILVCGADGFLGRHMVAALHDAGHAVVRGVHRPRLAGDIAIDYRRDHDVATWLPRLAGIDVVINAVGIIAERRAGDFSAIHHCAPAALFAACRQAGIRRVIQISALGNAATPYLQSKRAADQALLDRLPEGIVLRPGLVFGADGVSTRFFLMLASLPIIGNLLGAGAVQPVHVEDLVEVLVRLVDGPVPSSRIVDMPGPRRLNYRDWLSGYRAALGLAPAVLLPIPAPLVTATAWLSGQRRGALLSPDTWAMLRAGNVGDPAPARALLGRALIDPAHFIGADERDALRSQALAQWRGPLSRAVLAFLWIASAMLSMGVYPVDGSLALLASFGMAGTAALVTLVAASLLDLAMGVMTLLKPGRRLWLAQLALIAAYSLLIAWRLPDFLLHPFAPILKNLAMAVLLVQLWAEETTQ